MVALSVAFLCVFIFGAYAYGATVLWAVRAAPVWGKEHATAAGRTRDTLEPVTFTLCVVCTVWFVLNAVSEFRVLMGTAQYQTWLNLIELGLAFAFPPIIMHTVLKESHGYDVRPPAPWPQLLVAMYVVSFGTGVYMVLAAPAWIPRPQPFGVWVGASIGSMFTLCSVYCLAVMSRRTRPSLTPNRTRSHTAMRLLFFIMIAVFALVVFMRGPAPVMYAVNRLSRSLPIAFLLVSVYFASGFAFYDLIVKRTTMLIVSLFVLGGYLAVVLGALERLPGSAARPWLFAIAMLPVAMILPWLHGRLSRRLDRLWFGREFTPVEAVKHVLSGMQPATDERMLIEATEARLTDMFDAPVQILREGDPVPSGAIVETVGASESPDSAVRVAVVRRPESRPLLSEDVALLRSLASVFGYMLENVRLQRRRQEQDHVAQELRLQTSRSELKALRAQINPHFLFNALNTIASLIHTDPTRADAAVEQLAEVFRYTLRRSEQEWAPLDQELAFARAYLDVEQARFERRLSFAIDASPSTAHAQVPSMLLHTLVENAVKHGISPLRGPGRIDIHARADNGTLTLEVRDTGAGIEGGTRPRIEYGESFGLRSIHDRLRAHFGERASLSLTRAHENSVTIARVEIPLMTDHGVLARGSHTGFLQEVPAAGETADVQDHRDEAQ
jgi:signal transduction histidine kinase